MNEDEKQDKIPEVWEGHNIADYIDPDIMKVGVVSTLQSRHNLKFPSASERARELTFLSFSLLRNCKIWRGRRS